LILLELTEGFPSKCSCGVSLQSHTYGYCCCLVICYRNKNF
jgi:hypothetical protein